VQPTGNLYAVGTAMKTPVKRVAMLLAQGLAVLRRKGSAKTNGQPSIRARQAAHDVVGVELPNQADGL